MEDNIYKSPESELDNKDGEAGELASRWNRLFASIVDALIIGVVTLPVMYFTGGFDRITEGAQPMLLYTLMIGLISIVVFLVLNYSLLASNGQTIGKRVLSIKVVTLDDQQPSMGTHFLKRYAVYFGCGQIPTAGQLLSIINILTIFGKQRGSVCTLRLHARSRKPQQRRLSVQVTRGSRPLQIIINIQALTRTHAHVGQPAIRIHVSG